LRPFFLTPCLGIEKAALSPDCTDTLEKNNAMSPLRLRRIVKIFKANHSNGKRMIKSKIELGVSDQRAENKPLEPESG
jgi:hypothetical protein